MYTPTHKTTQPIAFLSLENLNILEYYHSQPGHPYESLPSDFILFKGIGLPPEHEAGRLRPQLKNSAFCPTLCG
jgi:hypothetical protein